MSKTVDAFGIEVSYRDIARVVGAEARGIQASIKKAGGPEAYLTKAGIVDEFYLLAALEEIKTGTVTNKNTVEEKAETARKVCDILGSAENPSEASQTDEAQTVDTLPTEQAEAAETATEAATDEQSNGGDDVYCRDNNGHWVDVDVEIHEGDMPEEKKEDDDMMMMIKEATETTEQVEGFDTEAATELEGDKAKLRVLNRLIADLNDEAVLQLLGEQADHARALAAHAEGVRIVECIHMLRIDEAMWAKAAE